MRKFGRREGGWLATGVLAVASGGAAVRPAAAQERRELTVEVSECVELDSPQERLACFEAQVEAARQPRTPEAGRGSAVAPAAADAAAPVRVADPQATPPVRELRRGEERERSGVVVGARVTELRRTVPNSYLITLDNGQMWRQIQPLRFPLRVGMEIEIYPPPRGEALRLKAVDLKGYIQVERVR
jgi:hypothetical protein